MREIIAPPYPRTFLDLEGGRDLKISTTDSTTVSCSAEETKMRSISYKISYSDRDRTTYTIRDPGEFTIIAFFICINQ